MTGSRHGRVVDFDQAVGLGTVEDDAHRRFGFHCTQIADGSRTIEVGATVRFEVVAARLGTWEAARVRPERPADPAESRPAG